MHHVVHNGSDDFFRRISPPFPTNTEHRLTLDCVLIIAEAYWPHLFMDADNMSSVIALSEKIFASGMI